MSNEQIQWAMQLREIPSTFYNALRKDDQQAMRHRPAAGEWSAIEVIGHMIDKISNWATRVERIWHEEKPKLPGYDQDLEVTKHDYQHADLAALRDQLAQQCERFASIVSDLPDSALQRQGLHGEFGPMTIQDCLKAVLDSVPEHLKQLQAAQASYTK